MSDTFGMLMLLASVLLALCQLEIIHRLHTWDNSPGSNSVSGTGSQMWRHCLKCKCAPEPFFPFRADQNGFIQETEITILKLSAEILYLYEKKMEFDCQMSVFSVATYLLCYSSCLKFPEPLIWSGAKHFIPVRATLHRRIVSYGKYSLFFFCPEFLF